MKRSWVSPPRYIFRKLNVMRELRSLGDISSALDVGCGAGDFACTLSLKHNIPVHGVDFASHAITTAKKMKRYHGAEKARFTLIDALEPKKLGKADLVTCFEVLEHVENDSALLKNLIKLSNKYVVISVPAKQKLFSKTDELAGHYRRYEKKELHHLLDKHGLHVISFHSYGYPFTNILRLMRELLAKKRGNSTSTPKEKGTKKSGVDLMDINKYFPASLETLLVPFYYISRLFNKTNLSEGYLVVCKKAA